MMHDDSEATAREEASFCNEARIEHCWDGERRCSERFQATLGLRSPAWDVYLLYGAGQIRIGEELPEPSFWMCQLPHQAGVSEELLLAPGTFARKLAALLGREQPVSQSDLGLRLHAKGLGAVKRSRSGSDTE
jgi:hypothetical protein